MTTPEGAPAPANTNPPVTPPAAVTPPAPAVAPPVDDQNPPWLAERLARAEAQALKRLGFKDEADAKAAAAAREAAAEAAKTTEQKRVEAEKRAKELEEEATSLRGTVALIAKSRLESLTELQRKAVTDISDDPSIQLEVIERMAPTWAAATPPAAPPAKAPATPPGGTAPPPNAPPGTVVSESNPKEVHAALLKTNPFAAAEFGLAHLREVFPESKS